MAQVMQPLRYNIDMQIDSSPNAKNGHNVAALTPLEISNLLDSKDREIIQLRRQVAWFQRQIFGQKSERRLSGPEGEQGILGEAFSAIPDQSEPNKKPPLLAIFVNQNKSRSTERMNRHCFLMSKRCRCRLLLLPILKSTA